MRALVAIAIAANVAHADPIELHAGSEAPPPAVTSPPEPTPALKLSLDTLALEDRRTITHYGPLELRGDWLDPGDGVHEAATRSWQAHARLSHAFGNTSIAVDLGAGQVVSDIAEGTIPGRVRTDVVGARYYEATVSLTRKLGDRGFLSLTATARHWLDRPPLGEGDGLTLMLWLGLHF